VAQQEWNECNMDRPTWLWWVWLPLTVLRLSRRAALSLLDGYYLVAWARASAFLPPLAFASGLLAGWARLGFDTAFSESLVLMTAVAMLSVFSANLGGLFVAGFALGNFLFTDPIASYYWRSRGDAWLLLRGKCAQLIEYGLLFWLAVNVPQLTKSLLATIRPPESLSRKAQLGVVVVGQAALTAFAVHWWVQTVPILIRPIFTWVRSNPPIAAVAPLQKYGWVVVCAAAVAAVIRAFLQAKAASDADLAERVDAWDEQWVLAAPPASITDQWNPWVLLSVQAGWSTLLLSGMMSHWLDALVLGALLLVTRAAQAGAIKIPLGGWPQLVTRAPALVRLAVGLVVISYLARQVMESQRYSSGSFRPILILTGLAMVILYLLNPTLPAQDREGGQ
jgi:hypothetical protein